MWTCIPRRTGSTYLLTVQFWFKKTPLYFAEIFLIIIIRTMPGCCWVWESLAVAPLPGAQCRGIRQQLPSSLLTGNIGLTLFTLDSCKENSDWELLHSNHFVWLSMSHICFKEFKSIETVCRVSFILALGTYGQLIVELITKISCLVHS